MPDFTRLFPLLELAVQEAQANARGAGQRECGQYGVDPDVVDDDLVVHQPAVHVDGAVSPVALAVARHSGRGRGSGRCGGNRLRCGRGSGGRQQCRVHGLCGVMGAGQGSRHKTRARSRLFLHRRTCAKIAKRVCQHWSVYLVFIS